MNCSIVLPIYNEANNLEELFQRLSESMLKGHIEHEIIAINDGSIDRTGEILKTLAAKNKLIKVINFERNYGQTAAIAAGIASARHSVIIPMDADLENDPSDVPRLLQKIDEGYDVVSGWRQNRWQGNLLRRWPSVIANKLISKLSGVPLSDSGCTLKAYRKDMVQGLQFYGDMHRFIPAYIGWNYDAKITEIPVSYTPRKHGKSNYGIGRIWKVLLDLLVLKFFADYSRRPIHLFGSIGFISIILGLISGAFSVYFKLSVVNHKDFIQTPLPVIMAMLIVVGVIMIMMGLLAEILVRSYFEIKNIEPYKIKERINF